MRLKSPTSSDLSESLLSSILQCPIACYATIRSRPMLSIRVRILRHHLHTALTSTDKRLDSVRLWKPNQPSTTPSPNRTNPTGNVEVPCCPASAQTPAPTTLTLTAWNCRGLNLIYTNWLKVGVTSLQRVNTGSGPLRQIVFTIFTQPLLRKSRLMKDLHKIQLLREAAVEWG